PGDQPRLEDPSPEQHDLPLLPRHLALKRLEHVVRFIGRNPVGLVIEPRTRGEGDVHGSGRCGKTGQQPRFAARSSKSLATTPHASAGATAVLCPGPCSDGRGTKAVRSPQPAAALRSLLWAATIMHCSVFKPSMSAVIVYASGCGL